MAFMSQEHKARIAAELKKVMPADWKYSLSVRHNSTIVLTISAAPVDLIAHMNEVSKGYWAYKHYPPQLWKDNAGVNEFHLDQQFSGEMLETFKRIKTALNLDNHDRSDIQSDYFDVGHYISIQIGKWDKPFQVLDVRGSQSGRELTYEELKARIAELEAKQSSGR